MIFFCLIQGHRKIENIRHLKFLLISMVANTKENGKAVVNMEKVFTIIVMETNMLEIGSMIRKKVKVFLLGLMVNDTKENLKKEISMEKVRNIWPMVPSMSVTGLMIE